MCLANLILLSLFCLCIGSSEIYHVSLNGNGTIALNWILDYQKSNIIYEVHLPSNFGWFALGYSDRGKHFPADYCILWRSLQGRHYFHDSWADTEGIIHLDKHQDCKNFKIKTINATTKFSFQRNFDTCDSNDYIIEEGTTHILWARDIKPLYKLNRLNISAIPSNENKGMIRTQLLKNADAETSLPNHVYTIDILTSNVTIPNVETTYWCHVHKLGKEFRNKHHVYRYESHIKKSSDGLVHHMEVFHCVAPANEEIPLYIGNCFDPNRPKATQVCKRVLAAWAMGAPQFTYPIEAGLPLGGDNFNAYIMLEVHYNNPERKAGFVDSSGIRFYVSSKLKDMDAGVMELGLEYTDKMAIPPNQESFPLVGYCVSECTAVSLPAEGITVFASQLHTHLVGTTVYTRHIRDGIEMDELNRDNHFSTHFQEIRRLKRPMKILPGDALVTRCNYNTEDRQNTTLGGYAITDEMCVNYIHYFPATNLEVCKSSISDQALDTYFRYMKEWENQEIEGNTISTNYNAIKWNKMRVALLLDVYNEAPLSMQCNMSSGARFPGYWENTPITPILKPLAPCSRKCAN